MLEAAAAIVILETTPDHVVLDAAPEQAKSMMGDLPQVSASRLRNSHHVASTSRFNHSREPGLAKQRAMTLP
jgi:hypothetical protein